MADAPGPVVNFAQLAAGTLAFSVALSWNEAVGHFVRRLCGRGRASAYALLLSALVVTLLVVAAAHALNAAGSRLGWRGPPRGGHGGHGGHGGDHGGHGGPVRLDFGGAPM